MPSDSGNTPSRGDAVRAFKLQYLDLYCREGGTPRDVAVALFDELAAWLDAPTDRRGLIRQKLARIAGLADDLSRLDKALRVLAQNLQLFGYRRTEWPKELQECARAQLTPPPAAFGLAPLDDLRTFIIGGVPMIVEVTGPTAAMRGDSNKGWYWLEANFRAATPPLDVLRLVANGSAIDGKQEARLTSWLRTHFANVRELDGGHTAVHAECAELLRALTTRWDKRHRWLKQRLDYLEQDPAIDDKLRGIFERDIQALRNEIAGCDRVLSAAGVVLQPADEDSPSSDE